MTHWIKCLPFKYERYSFNLHITDESTWDLCSAIIPQSKVFVRLVKSKCSHIRPIHMHRDTHMKLNFMKSI